MMSGTSHFLIQTVKEFHMRRFHFIVFTCIIFIACKSKPPYIELAIDNTRIDSTHDISDLIDNIKITKLEETDEEPIGTVFNISRRKNFYLIHDRLSVNKIFLFNDS